MGNVMPQEWNGFKPGRWSSSSINVRDFIQKNYTQYDGDASFLAPPTESTKKLWAQVMELSAQEREHGGVLDMDTKIISTITSHGRRALCSSCHMINGVKFMCNMTDNSQAYDVPCALLP